MPRDRSNGLLIALGGFFVGSLVGILIAPQSGRRTRALVRDKSVKYSHDIADYAGKKTRHTANKLRGYAHEAKELISSKIGSTEESSVNI